MVVRFLLMCCCYWFSWEGVGCASFHVQEPGVHLILSQLEPLVLFVVKFYLSGRSFLFAQIYLFLPGTCYHFLDGHYCEESASSDHAYELLAIFCRGCSYVRGN